jgi:two-component system osmolarity sensor histidine kinase EnvZ
MMRLWPRSLLGRNVLLLSILILAGEALLIGTFAAFVQKPRIDDAASLVASQIMLANRLLNAFPENERRQTLRQMQSVPDAAMAASGIRLRLATGYRMHRFFADLEARLPHDALVRWESGANHRLWVRLPVGAEAVWIPLPMTPAVDTSLSWSLVCLLLTLAALPALGAWLIQRRVQRPLQRLAQAAKSIESGVWPEAVPIEGALELSTVAEAFNRMTRSLSEMEAARAEMLAGISHDIRTPLTKLRMAIAAPESFDAPLASAERYVEEIDAIVQQFIDFARGSGNEAAAPGDINRLIEQLAGDYAGLGHPFALTLGALPPLAYRPVGMQRLLMNLMQNATVHGRVGLSIDTREEAGCAVITVADRGPGVDDAALRLIKQPFRRGAGADHNDVGHAKAGSGLGLAIAERIVRDHGGRLDLTRRPGGGLAATIRLPAAAPSESGC